jgi:hypothetical protein
MSRLLVVISRGNRLEGVLADEVHADGSGHVFTLSGAEVARARSDESFVTCRRPSSRFLEGPAGPTVGAAR